MPGATCSTWGLASARKLLAEGHEVLLHARTRERAAALDELAPHAAGIVIGDLSCAAETRGLAGQRAYLARLRCPDRKRPKVLGRGLGPPSPFGGVGDSFGVTCAGTRHQIEMDMYHDHVEPRPVPGFTIVAR